MAIAEDRLSTSVVAGAYLSPDDRWHGSLHDYEKGPAGLNDPSRGLAYQVWRMDWSNTTGDFTVTPETVGNPSSIINVSGVTQASFAFDQNGHVSIAYSVGVDAFLYWYDTNAAGWVTTQLIAGATYPMLTLDDKRSTQTNANDILLWYTRQQGDNTWNLYKREQRERYLIEDLMASDVYPYLFKVGMHRNLRVQLSLRSAPY